MPEFEPFPILEQDIGIYNARANWQSPERSWRTLTNFFIRNGRLACRAGQSIFGKLYPAVADTLLTSNPMHFFLPGPYPIHPAEPGPSTYGVTITDGVFTIGDDGEGSLLRLDTLAGVGTIDYATGEIFMTWPVGGAVLLTRTWEFERFLPVVGIADFFPRSSSEFLVAFDTKRAYLWSDAQQRFNDIIKADTFTGTQRDYFWFVPFDDRLIFCNGVDKVFKYEPLGAPPVIVENPTNFDGIAGNDINTVQMGIRHKGMLHYLYPKEAGNEFPQRARRTKVDDPTSFRDQFAYTDAPTDRAIIGAVPVADSIVVFFERNETWRHRWTGDPKNPYAWERISRERGSWAPFAAVEMDAGGLTLDGGGLVFTDGQRIQPFRTDLLEDFPFAVNVSSVDVAFGLHYPERLEIWITVPTSAATMPNAVMLINTVDSIFSRLNFTDPPNVLGFYRETGVLLWDDISGTWDENALIPDEVGGGGIGSVILLGGTDHGVVTALNTGPDDIGVTFSAEGQTAFLNPFGGMEVHFGYIDFYMQPAEARILRVYFYKDFETSAYYQADIDLTSSSDESSDTIIRRVSVNQIGNAHAIRIELPSAIAGWRFYGMVPFMKPVGPVGAQL